MLGIKAISDVNLKVKKLIIIKKQRIWNIYFHVFYFLVCFETRSVISSAYAERVFFSVQLLIQSVCLCVGVDVFPHGL